MSLRVCIPATLLVLCAPLAAAPPAAAVHAAAVHAAAVQQAVVQRAAGQQAAGQRAAGQQAAGQQAAGQQAAGQQAAGQQAAGQQAAGQRAQGPGAVELHGVVLDGEGEPVVDAQVRLLGPNRSVVQDTTTDPEGRFRFADVRRGVYEIRVVAPPFRSRDRVVNVDGELPELTFRMAAGEVQENVTVTASRGMLRASSDVPATVMSLDIDELESRAVDLLPRMLAEEPGVLAQQTTPGQGSPILRGLSAQSALYLVDGVRYNNSTYRGGNTQYLSWIPTVSTGTVEVQLGPSGVNYGSDALGGAVNVISAQVPALQREGWSLDGSARVFGEATTLGVGTDLTLGVAGESLAGFVAGTGARHQDLRPGGGEDSRNVLIRFGGLTRDQVQDILGSRLQDTAFGRSGFSSKAVYRWGQGASLTGFFTRSDQYDVRRYDRLLGGDGRLRAAFTPQRLEFGYARYQDVFGETFFEATVSLNRQVDGREDQAFENTDLEIEDNAATAFGYETAASWLWGDHAISAGAEVYDEYIDSTAEAIPPGGQPFEVRGRYPDEARYTSFGAFFLDDWSTLDDRLQVSAGTRFSAFRFSTEAAENVIDGVPVVPDNTETFTDLTFNGGATWNFTDRVSAFGRVARGFRAPNVNDLGEQGLTGGGFEVSPREAVDAGAIIGTSSGPDAVGTGDPWQSLSPEVLWSFEGGWRYEDPVTRIELTLFDSELFDSISRRAVIFAGDVVGDTIAGETIVSQDEQGRGFVARDPRPVVSRANIGRKRIWGVEGMFRRVWADQWRTTFKFGVQRGEELATGNPADKVVPDHATASLRWTDPRNDLWIEGILVGMTAQDRLNPDDIQDARIGAFRSARQIERFFRSTAPRLGLVANGVFLPTGETLAELQRRILGPGLEGDVLFEEFPGFVVVNLRGAYAFSEHHKVMFNLENLLDRNYRILGSGFDAPGINLALSYEANF